jgi:hypothetical protein
VAADGEMAALAALAGERAALEAAHAALAADHAVLSAARGDLAAELAVLRTRQRRHAHPQAKQAVLLEWCGSDGSDIGSPPTPVSPQTEPSSRSRSRSRASGCESTESEGEGSSPASPVIAPRSAACPAAC